LWLRQIHADEGRDRAVAGHGRDRLRERQGSRWAAEHRGHGVSELLPWRTTLANVMLPLEIVAPHCSRLRRERAAYEAKARDLLALVGLKGFEDHFPWQLSGGMQQRASLCRALIHDPSLLMLDEPFASLDMFTREELWLALQDLWLARKPTVILVTHDLREA